MIQERRQFLVDTPLAPDERQRLEVYEAAIEANFAAQTAGVLAAEQIRTERLWREEWESFSHYCEDRWHVSQEMMNKRIRAARVVRTLEEHVTEAVPENGSAKEHVTPNVRQALELAKLDDPQDQREVWDEVTAAATEAAPVTAKKVEEAVRSRKEETAAKKAPDLRERAFQLAADLPAERDAARTLVMMPGLPPDRAIVILERLAAMGAKQSQALLRRWQSADEREQKAALAVMQGKHPPADPRLLVLESLMDDLIQCREMFPDDSLTFKFRHLVGMATDLVSALKEQEEERYRGTVAV